MRWGLDVIIFCICSSCVLLPIHVTVLYHGLMLYRQRVIIINYNILLIRQVKCQLTVLRTQHYHANTLG